MYKGILGLVLWLSMLSGVLPYKLGSCWLTILLVPYTFIVFSFTSLFITANHVLLFIYKYDKSQSSITMQIIQWCSNSLLILVNAISIFTAVKRLRHMDRSLKQLKQMKEKLTHMSIPRDTRTQCLVLLSILMTAATRGTDYFLFVFQHIKWFHNNSQITVHQCWMILVQMQTVAFAARVLLYLRAINNTLYKLTIDENLQTKIIKEDRIVSNFAWEYSATYTDAGRLRNVLPRYKSIPVNVATKVANITTSGLNQDESVEYTIRRISECYNIVLNIVRKTTEVDGKLIIVIIFCHMLYSELNLFRFIVWVTGEEKVTIVTMYVLVHSILHALALMVLVDPFHRTHAEMERTNLLVQSLKFRCKDHQPLYNELELFQRHLLLQKTTYSPLGMCTLDRSLVLNIFGTLISYLIIITTYGPPVDSPLLFMLSKEA